MHKSPFGKGGFGYDEENHQSHALTGRLVRGGAGGGRRGAPWLGPLVMVPVLAVHLSLTDDRQRELKLLLAAGVLGFLYDTALVSAGVFSPLRHLVPHAFSPPWMVGLWMNFAATLNVSMAWLRGHYLLAAVFGSIGGPLAYYGGAKLGATEALPSLNGMLVLAVGGE